MPTASITPSGPITIPNGGSVDVEVTWALDPGTPGETGTLAVTLDGQALFQAQVQKPGTPGESEPVIVLSNPQAGQAHLTSDVAQITQLGPRSFRLF